MQILIPLRIFHNTPKIRLVSAAANDTHQRGFSACRNLSQRQPVVRKHHEHHHPHIIIRTKSPKERLLTVFVILSHT